ncbi:MAG: helix-turn-helix transcriptional regulator [Proteobacteria bacterium]|nr:helix-turn-helix transcriptional regulator [Pseudomonadota bacterium]
MGLAIEITDKIKKVLRSKNLTYKDLAIHLNLSESALKRAFAKEEFSLSRLEAICSFLDISLQDLAEVNKRHEKTCFLTSDQELALAADEKLFVVFYLSFDFSADAMVQRFSFTPQEIERHLLHLDKLGLIKLLPYNHIQVLVTQSIWWDPRGPLSQKYYSLIKTDFISSLFDSDHEAQWFVSAKSTVGTLDMFRKKLNRLVSELRELVDLDEEEAEKVQFTFFAGYRPWVLPILNDYLRTK